MKRLKIVITIILLLDSFVMAMDDASAGGGLFFTSLGIIYLMFRRKKPKQDIQTMNGLDFEHYCAKWLLRKGFVRAEVTPSIGDYGADIIAVDRQGQKWVFQCKRYAGKVSNKAVQEAVAAKAHYRAERAGVITNSRLTDKARELAFENAVELFEALDD